MNSELTPPFKLLIGAYFNEDWDCEGPNSIAILEKATREMPVDDVMDARDAAATLLSSHETDAELENEQLDHRQWLEIVISTLTRLVNREDGTL